MTRAQRSDGLSGRDGLSGPHTRAYRLVGGPQAAWMVDAHHLAPGDQAGERDHTGAGGVDHRVRLAGKVNSPVTG